MAKRCWEIKELKAQLEKNETFQVVQLGNLGEEGSCCLEKGNSRQMFMFMMHKLLHQDTVQGLVLTNR